MTQPKPAYTREQVQTALARGIDLVDAITDAVVLARLELLTISTLGDGQVFTYTEVSNTLNAAANQLEASENPDGGETSETIWTQDVLNLAVNAVEHMLDHPGADLYAVIAESYKYTEPVFYLNEGQPAPPKSSEAWNDALYETVTGWIS